MEPKLFIEPNKFTKKASITFNGNEAVVTGYNNYKLTPNGLIAIGNKKKIEKFELLKKLILKEVSGKDVLDLGCATGIISVASAIWGANIVKAIDMDKEHCDVLRTIASKYDLKIDVKTGDVQDIEGEYDIVFALGLIHWLYSCTAYFGSINNIIKWLKTLTKEVLIIEFVDPEDPNIKQFGHLEYNTDIQESQYNEKNFLNSLKRNFKQFELIGGTDHRKIYKAII